MIQWNADQVALRDAMARWYDGLNADHIAQDAAATFSWEKWKLLQRSGLFALPIDERWGGLGQDLLTTMYVLEGLGYGCRDAGLSFSASTHMVSTGVPLQRFGTTELKERYLPRLAAGDAIGAHAITESQGGSDALAMRTRATRDGDHYVLAGSKAFVSNAPVADLFVVYARTNPDGGPLGVTAFLVERETPGLEIGPPIGKMGLRSAPIAELFFDDCRVPASNVIGRAGAGFLVLDYVMQREILCSFVVNVGEMQHQLERCIDYARTRTAFGQPIGKHQAIARRIVDMHMRVETARMWLYETAERLEAGENVTVDIAVCKLLTSEGNLASSLSAVQIFGGHGYTTEYGLEKDLRNAVAGTIYSGTTEIQYNRIAALLGL